MPVLAWESLNLQPILHISIACPLANNTQTEGLQTKYPIRILMPKIKSFAPSWLNEPSPAHKLFEQPTDDARIPAALPYGKKPKPGPRRTIAKRGAEVFVAVGKQIRWGDLAQLKETWEAKNARSGSRIKRESPEPDFGDGDIDENGTGGYRVSSTRGPYKTRPQSREFCPNNECRRLPDHQDARCR